MELSFDDKVALFQAIAHDPKARNEYAQSRAEVILPLINEQSTIRNIFVPERIPAGGQATFDLPFEDIEACWTMPHIGGIPQVQVEGTETTISTFMLDAAVQWQMRIAREGRFQVGQRATQLLKNHVIKQEELAGWGLIHSHAATIGAGQQVAASSLDLATFNSIITKADVLDREITDIYVSPTRFSDLRDWVTTTDHSDSLKDRAFSQGGLKEIWDVRVNKVRNTDLVANNKAYAFGRREGFMYGVMPVRQELQTFDNPIAIMEWKIGIMANEEVGFGILDDKGLIEVTFS
jgi:hypothetical protein